MAARRISKRQRSLAATLAGLDLEARLLAGLDPLTRRELVVYPPRADETMQHIGIGATNLDTVVRSWVNREFRRPANKPALPSGTIVPRTKWGEFVDMCK